MDKKSIEEIVRQTFPLAEPRPNQIEIITDILYEFVENNKRHVILSAPTGSGKSVIAWTVAKVISQIYKPEDYKLSQFDSWSFKTTILTANKNLQKQYFEEFTMDNLWGKTNYFCHHNTEYNSGECFLHLKNDECSTAQCAYHKTRKVWLSSQLRLTNMSFQIEACDTIVNKVSNRASLVVIDECHDFGAAIQNHCVAVFDKEEFARNQHFIKKSTIKKVNEFLDKINRTIQDNTDGDICRIPESKESLFRDFKDFCEASYQSLKLVRNGFDPKTQKKEILQVSDSISHLGELSDLSELILHNLNQPMLNENGKLRPIFPGSFAYYALYRKADKFLHMSATICNPESYAREVGAHNFTYIEMPNEIPSSNRKVIASSIQKVSNSKLSSDMLDAIDKICGENEYLNGVIHTVSYSRASEILQNSAHRERMFISAEKEEIIENLKEATGKILLSPFAFEGLDFKDDLARFQIIPKIPYLSIDDRLNQLIFTMNKSLYFRRAVVKTVQSSGRSTRHKDDFSVIYILDSAFYDLYKYNKYLFPKWYQDSVFYKSKKEFLAET